MPSPYLQWRTQAEQTGLGWIAAREYYRCRHPQFDAYTASIDGDTHTYPLFTTDDWLTPETGLDTVSLTINDESRTDINRDYIQSVVDRVTHLTDTNPTISEHLWNGDIYALDSINPTSPALTLRQSDYFTALTTNERLSEELLQVLYTHGVPTDGTATECRDAIDKNTFPNRAETAATRNSFFTHSDYSAVGLGALTAVETGDDVLFPVFQRGEQLPVDATLYNIPPAGTLSPGELGDERSLRQFLLTELGEELFGSEGEVGSTELTTRVRDQISTGDVYLDYLGVGVDMYRTNTHLRSLLYVDDATLGERVIADAESNWEGGDIEWVSIRDTPRLKEFLQPNRLPPEHAMNVIEGVRRLSAEYDVSGVPLIESGVQSVGGTGGV